MSNQHVSGPAQQRSRWGCSRLGAHVTLTSGHKPPPAVDPEAVKFLRGMTDYLGSLKQFSVHVRNMREDLLDSGHTSRFRDSQAC